MAVAQQHTFQILTKRPERMAEWFKGDLLQGRSDTVAAAAWGMSIALFDNVPTTGKHDPDTCSLGGYGRKCRFCDPYFKLRRPFPGWPLPNVHLYVSVENQYWADHRIPLLLQTPAAVRGVSYEPALKAVDFRKWLSCWCPCHLVQPTAQDEATGMKGWDVPCSMCGKLYDQNIRQGLDHIIMGGESGPKARPIDIEWVRSTIAQCKAADVPVFIKQMGSVWAKEHGSKSKGENMETWPEDLRIRKYPNAKR